jgi:hypothetical protein
MERTLTAFSAIVLLIGCCTGCGRYKEHIKIPEITFMYTKSYEDEYSLNFCDSDGNYYLAMTDDVREMSIDKLCREFSEGRLDGDIKLVRTADKKDFISNYNKLVKASEKDDIGLVYPDSVPAVEAPEYNWFCIVYDENDNYKTVTFHKNTCMTSIDTGNDDLNYVYKWFSEAFSEK